jgi:hypothetical protein
MLVDVFYFAHYIHIIDYVYHTPFCKNVIILWHTGLLYLINQRAINEQSGTFG